MLRGLDAARLGENLGEACGSMSGTGTPRLLSGTAISQIYGAQAEMESMLKQDSSLEAVW